MEVKINKEIREYTESVFFGLSLRQLIFSALACCVAVGLYFILRPFFGIETLSWMCILGAAPFAALGYLRYNGMSAEQFLWAFVKCRLLTPKVLLFRSVNFYYEALQEMRKDDKKFKKGHRKSHTKKLHKRTERKVGTTHE